MKDKLDIEEVESFANVKITARLDQDQYVVLVACMAEWCDDHPDQPRAIRTLESIDFIRTA